MSAVDVVVIPLGGSNFISLEHACRRIGVEPTFSTDRRRIGAATHLILPGVGAAAPAMAALRAHGLDRDLARTTQPLLGICLGMQLLFEGSAEGDVDTLGRLPGRVERLPAAPTWPHMGWNTVAATRAHPLLDGLGDDSWFYFVHGYAAGTGAHTIARSDHGTAFSAVVSNGVVHGTQFHPEKSAAAGRRVLANFFAPCN